MLCEAADCGNAAGGQERGCRPAGDERGCEWKEGEQQPAACRHFVDCSRVHFCQKWTDLTIRIDKLVKKLFDLQKPLWVFAPLSPFHNNE